jgi:hypothetical protein
MTCIDLNDVGEMALSPFAADARTLIGLGFSPLPIKEGTKRPDARNWQKACDESIGEELLAAVIEQNKHGIGVACGFRGLIAVDIDTEDPEIIATVRRILPESCVAKRGKKGRTDFYRDSTGEVRNRNSRGETAGRRFSKSWPSVRKPLSHQPFIPRPAPHMCG